MIFRTILRSPRVLNIFTDASITNMNDKYVSCPGYVALTTSEDNQDILLSSNQVIIEDSTNNNGEIKAISMGIDYAILQMYNFDYINLFSDSKICIYGLREWIYNWINNISLNDDGYTYSMYNSSSKLVANQNEFISIVNKIINNNLNICLYHQSGHVSDTQKSIYEAMKVFKSSNYFKGPLNYSDIVYISQYNNMVDNNTRNYLANYIYTGISNKNVVQFAYYSDLNINKYAELTNKNLLKGGY